MPGFKFADLVEIDHIRQLLEVQVNTTGLSAAVLDDKMEVIAAVGGKGACDSFCPGLACCSESNIAEGFPHGRDGTVSTCKCGNASKCAALPIVVDGRAIAFLRVGPFSLGNEQEDPPPKIRETLHHWTAFFRMIAETGLKNLQLARELEERRRSEAVLNKIFRTIPDQIHYIDREFRIILSNWQGYDYVPEEQRNLNPFCYEVFYGLAAPCENCHAMEVFKTGKPTITEKLNPRVGHVEIRAYPVFDDQGEVVMALEHICSINERKSAEEKWHSLYENLPGGSFTVNDRYIIEDVNDVLCAVTGFSREELVGQLCNIICPKGPHLCPIFDLGKERIDNDETAVKAKDGRHVPIIKSARKIRAGQRELIVENFQDVTERKYLEEQLRHVQKMDALGQLAGGVAHDFNNLLTVIMGYGSLLQRKLGKDELGKYATGIISSVERAASLTRSLLSFSRKHVVNLKPFSVNDTVQKAVKLLSRLIPEDTTLEVITKDDCIVRGDALQIEQVLMNLVTNALDAMPEGGKVIISTEPVELDSDYIRKEGYGEPGNFVCILVSDTGVGIDAETREKVFEPFFTTKEVGKGTGLGLFIVYGIVKQHNGYIHVRSTPGEGTTVEIYLPVVDGGARKDEETEQVELQKGSETILLAEDEPEVRNLVKAMLEELGYTVVEAEDGVDAVARFRDNAGGIDLLLLDVIMPNKNGKQALDEIRNIRPDVDVLFMSGYTDDILGKRGLIEGNLSFLSKPVTQDRLAHKIREILDRNSTPEKLA